MGFGEAVQYGFRHYFDFSGRAPRSAFWWFVLFALALVFVAAFIGGALGGEHGGNVAYGLVVMALVVPWISISIRRLHDADLSGWWFLLSFIPFVGFFIMIGLMAARGTPGPNRFGHPLTLQA